MKQKIYIAGPMSGKKNHNFEAFIEAEKILKKDYRVINPVHLSEKLAKKLNKPIPEITRYQFYEFDIPYILKCENMYMLKGWRYSLGATLEHYIAMSLKKNIIYQK